ncbi:unnamed protein product [Notodromas monacha]|uniref:Uncharacterized protein n=1 Tax=Notodromas monacha TaxID=399045 RepID=A0A7R9BJH8_9CRUS|nr:unnamed protein product [Notodromas monacha]CAG0915261.1 unnamed protein product [Notodromas monacha]
MLWSDLFGSEGVGECWAMCGAVLTAAPADLYTSIDAEDVKSGIGSTREIGKSGLVEKANVGVEAPGVDDVAGPLPSQCSRKVWLKEENDREREEVGAVFTGSAAELVWAGFCCVMPLSSLARPHAKT